MGEKDAQGKGELSEEIPWPLLREERGKSQMGEKGGWKIKDTS